MGSIVGIIVGLAMASYAATTVFSSAPHSSTWSGVFNVLNIPAGMLAFAIGYVVHPGEIGWATSPYLVLIVLQWFLIGSGIGALTTWFRSFRKGKANKPLQGTPAKAPSSSAEPEGRRS